MRITLPQAKIPNGIVVYRGESQINGEPIVAIVTGFVNATENEKTGDMLQLWIIADNDCGPADAIESGDDESVCGDCKHRGTSCYVNVYFSVNAVYNAFKRGIYPMAKPSHLAMFNGRKIRLGAYGDPAALPFELLDTMTKASNGHTGYTHAWKYCDQRLQSLIMASVDNVAEYREAHANNWRTFRTQYGGVTTLPGEFVCPASVTGNKRQCADCMACDGGNPPKGSVTIMAHGGVTKRAAIRNNIEHYSVGA